MVVFYFAFVAVTVFSILCSGRVSDVYKRQDDQSLKTQLQNICDRKYSATAIVGDKLFINGGQDLKNRNTSTLQYVNFGYTQYIDLSSSWSIDNPPLTTLAKKTFISINEGCGWSDGTDFYQYGGWQTETNIQEDFKIWQYKTSSNTWTTVSTNSQNVERLGSGGYTNAPGIKKSYAFGGFLDQATTNNPWYYSQGKLNGAAGRADLIEFDWATKTAKNITFTNNTKRKLGTFDNSLAYVPAGKSGILLSIGGRDTLTLASYQQMANLAEIKFYDIASNTWYYQIAEGAVHPDAVPTSRVEPCVVVQTAADNSSYNIYMFGGSWADDERSAYNDMWILSLPSFKWFKVEYPTQASWQIAGGRTSHTCQIIGNRQMAIIGGGRSAEAHNQCRNTSLFVFDMSTLSWRNGFDSTQDAYVLPALITDVIGGHGGGGADLTLNRPTLWNDADATKIFTRDESAAPASGTGVAAPSTTASASASAPTSTGAIVGGVVGGVLALAVLGAIGMVWYKRRGRKAARIAELDIQELSLGEAPYELQGPNPNLHELQGGTEESLEAATKGEYTPKEHPENTDAPEPGGFPLQPPWKQGDYYLPRKRLPGS